MNDEELERGLREAARQLDAAPRGALGAPLGPSFEADVAAKILAGQRTTRERARSRRARFLWSGVGGLAAAAGIALAVGHSRPPTSQGLPVYALEVTGGDESERSVAPGAGAAPITVHPDSSLTLVLRPSSAVSGPLDVKVLGLRGTLAADARAVVRTSPAGSVDVRGRVSDLVGPEPGDAALVVVISRAGAGVDPLAAAQGTAPRTPEVSVARVAVHVVP